MSMSEAALIYAVKPSYIWFFILANKRRYIENLKNISIYVKYI